MSAQEISLAFATLAEWLVLQGAVDLPNKPGLWQGKLGDFDVSVNLHGEQHQNAAGLPIPPMSIAVINPKYLGAVMVVGLNGGACAPGMEDEVIALAEAEIAKAEGRS